MILGQKKKKGFTLLELLVVCTIISMLLGISSAFLTQYNKRLALSSASKQTSLTIREAKNFALEARAPSLVEINKSAGTILVQGEKIVGYWHLEDLTSTGAFGLDAQIDKGKLVAGKIGQGIEFRGQGGINCGECNRFGYYDKFVLSLWIFPYTATLGVESTLWKMGEYSLHLSLDNTLYFMKKGSKNKFDFFPPLYSWTHLRVEKRDKLLFVYANQKFIGTVFLGEPFLLTQEPLIWAEKFYGKIDEISLSAISIVEEYSLPERISFKEAPAKIEFDYEGNLNPRKHLVPLSIVLFDESSPEKLPVIEISLIGSVRITEQVHKPKEEVTNDDHKTK